MTNIMKWAKKALGILIVVLWVAFTSGLVTFLIAIFTGEVDLFRDSFLIG